MLIRTVAWNCGRNNARQYIRQELTRAVMALSSERARTAYSSPAMPPPMQEAELCQQQPPLRQFYDSPSSARAAADAAPAWTARRGTALHGKPDRQSD